MSLCYGARVIAACSKLLHDVAHVVAAIQSWCRRSHVRGTNNFFAVGLSGYCAATLDNESTCGCDIGRGCPRHLITRWRRIVERATARQRAQCFIQLR
jgi:hypothetical protein